MIEATVRKPSGHLDRITSERTLNLIALGLGMLVLLGALGLRLASWQAARGYNIIADEKEYAIPAEMLTRTGRYQDTFQTMGTLWTRVPLTGLLLAAAFQTQPPVPPETPPTDTGLMVNRYAAGNLALIGVSLALIPLIMRLAAEAFPTHSRRTALLAGAITAAYSPLTNSAAQHLLSETLFITLGFSALVALTRWQPYRGSWPWLLNAGLLLGLAGLARPAAIMFFPFLAAWFWSVLRAKRWAGRENGNGGVDHGQQAPAESPLGTGTLVRSPRGAGRTAISTFALTLVTIAGFLLAISPWTLYNYQSYGRLLLLDTASINAFWEFNNYSHEDRVSMLSTLPNPADRLWDSYRGIGKLTE
jgi:hypothetical protein